MNAPVNDELWRSEDASAFRSGAAEVSEKGFRELVRLMYLLLVKKPRKELTVRLLTTQLSASTMFIWSSMSGMPA